MSHPINTYDGTLILVDRKVPTPKQARQKVKTAAEHIEQASNVLMALDHLPTVLALRHDLLADAKRLAELYGEIGEKA